ncbi:MAG: hypothetical protein ACXAD7_01055 [Candidatus Kariarchaeaceae archaeon]|jgi:hypothetical protein
MQKILVIGSLLFLVLPFSLWITSSEGFAGDRTTTLASAFLYHAINDTGGDSFFDDNEGFESDWLAEDGMYGLLYFTEDTWMLGLVALVLGMASLIAAIMDVHRFQGLLLIIGGVLVAIARYIKLDDMGISYYEKNELGGGASITYAEIPLALVIGLVFGLLSMRSQD